MALLLNIDTATETASVCVSKDGRCLAFRENQQQREHASFVHAAVEEILQEANVQLQEMDAFAVSSGPGSYTGLRVGYATAKGFCYAFAKPLIAVNTLDIMAKAALETIEKDENIFLICPMLDARRMEVFTALYDVNLNNIMPPKPLILEEKSFDEVLCQGRVLFSGSGSIKFKSLKFSKNMIFKDVSYHVKHLASLAEKAFDEKAFADTSYSEPQYLKEFHSTATN